MSVEQPSHGTARSFGITHGVRALVAMSIVGVVLSAILGTASADARITVAGGAKIECAPGKVFAYAPSDNAYGITLDRPNTWVSIRSFLQYWDASQARWFETTPYGSPWWAHATSGTLFGAKGYGLAKGASTSAWLDANLNISNLFFPYYTFTVQRGYYYRVITQVWDRGDGSWINITNRVNTTYGDEYCWA